MGPKVFISSTFYDLKFVREDIGEFVKRYSFEAILFENGDIGYVPGRPLDESCYHYISRSDMVILIIGGLYGSPATDEVEDKFKEYMSITRKEFQAAKDAEIPIYVFILSEVDAEYWVYQKNYDGIENHGQKIAFSATKNINVFRFIMSIRSYPNVVINTFRKTSDIKDYLSGQWAGCFLHYLELLRSDKKNTEIENSLVTLKKNIEQINLMVDEVGKKLLGETEVKNYEEIKKDQTISDIKNIIANSFTYTSWFSTYEQQSDFVRLLVQKVSQMLKDRTFYLYLSEDHDDIDRFYAEFKFDNAIVDNIKPGVEIELKTYLDDLQKEWVQQGVAQELLKDKKFCPIELS